MAEAKMEILVEKVVAHDILRQVAQQIWDEHGMRLDSVSFTWIDTSSPGEDRFEVSEVSMQSYTRGVVSVSGSRNNE